MKKSSSLIVKWLLLPLAHVSDPWAGFDPPRRTCRAPTRRVILS